MIKFYLKNLSIFYMVKSVPVVKFFFVFHLPSVKKLNNKYDKLDFSFIRYGDKTSKHTSANRFFDLDNLVLKNLNDTDNKILDIGISSGITSYELYEKLIKAKKKFKLSLCDKFSKFYYQSGFLDIVYDHKKNKKNIYFLKILFDPNLSPIFFISKFFYYIISLFGNRSSNYKEINLLDKKILTKIEKGEIEYFDLDIFNSFLKQKYSFIRCMNVLNLSYFSEDKILLGIKNIFKLLREEGYLIIGRTNDKGINNVSLYIKKKNKLKVLRKVNKGCDINHLILKEIY